MTETRVYISGMGVVSCLGTGVLETTDAIRKGLSGLGPLTLFPIACTDPAGQVSGLFQTEAVPRTHQLARLAADQAMAASDDGTVDAIVLGTTTGGMATTEELLEKKKDDPRLFRHHSAASVAEDLARRYRCKGPAITICTACSSGAVAIKLALEMLRAGLAERVLAGGADSLCRLTYYGFKSLQLIDPEGSRPLDKDRRGMSLSEGAAMLLLSSNRPDNAMAELLGAGLSCDAYHPVKPHPNGRGALAAMRAAIRDAGISESDIDYINLHGTGTPDNDLSEAEAIRSLFPDEKPSMSSVKGGFGHSLAAAGAIETVVSAISISNNLIPANVGCTLPDAGLKLNPVMKPTGKPVDCVLSNSFGFGGNNASVVIGGPGKHRSPAPFLEMEPMAVLGYACLTGAGDTKSTVASLLAGRGCKGALPLQEISRNLSSQVVRRLKRLPRLALSLAIAAHGNSGRAVPPSSVFLGTGWGALSETCDFLAGLFETGGRFPSPTDFVGSVHNGPAGQVALHFQSTGFNITTSGGDQSFEQALMAAHLLTRGGDDSSFVMGADESHPILSKCFDESVLTDETLSDGGGAFCLGKGNGEPGLYIRLSFYENVENNPEVISSLTGRLGGPDRIKSAYGAVLTGMPGACRREGEEQLQRFLSLAAFENPVIDYRRLAGEFASSSAVAAVLAAGFMEEGKIPGPLCSGQPLPLDGKGVLVLGLGKFVTAVEVFRR
ncbi:MAG: 3-oxoacyl-ACP synthase [Deltaproteobacteria bacterium HGW-Deltaproteobacteria-15]|nr:MAG: 3-oxoacyl-ACP synthase [Deltaproteobacteria bacterium HGW-Deltaproteobacteria-15]